MTCRIADFGLSFDLAASKSSEGAGIYGAVDDAPAAPDGEALKIPVRWTAIEVRPACLVRGLPQAFCDRTLSSLTASLPPSPLISPDRRPSCSASSLRRRMCGRLACFCGRSGHTPRFRARVQLTADAVQGLGQQEGHRRVQQGLPHAQARPVPVRGLPPHDRVLGLPRQGLVAGCPRHCRVVLLRVVFALCVLLPLSLFVVAHVQRRITFPKAHAGLVQIWKEMDRLVRAALPLLSPQAAGDGEQGGTLYETSATFGDAQDDNCWSLFRHSPGCCRSQISQRRLLQSPDGFGRFPIAR